MRLEQPSIEVLLDHEVDALDQLVGEVRRGIRSQAHFDTLEEEADGIAGRLRAIFRTRLKPAR